MEPLRTILQARSLTIPAQKTFCPTLTRPLSDLYF